METWAMAATLVMELVAGCGRCSGPGAGSSLTGVVSGLDAGMASITADGCLFMGLAVFGMTACGRHMLVMRVGAHLMDGNTLTAAHAVRAGGRRMRAQVTRPR